MALTNDMGNMVMPVAPTGFGSGFGGDGSWWILLLFILLGGWGNGYGNGFGGFGNDGLYPWMNNSNQINNGFRDQMINGNINGIQSAITSGFGDVQNSLCAGFAGVNAGIANGFAQAEIANNARQMADMNQNFALQSQLAQCCCDNRLATADTKYTIATEACANRTASSQNTRDIIDAQTRGTQAILDKLCQLELDGVKGELSNANNTINQLRTQLLVANNEASQTAQTAAILAGQNAEVDALYNRLNNCPIPTTPVYGRTPIFSCGGNGGCGCGA